MPLYDFHCARGHSTELLRSHGCDQVACPECGGVAERSRVARIAHQIADTVVTDKYRTPTDFREDYRRFREASEARDDRFSSIERREGAPLHAPDLFGAAKQRAQKLAAAGVKATEITT